MASLGFEKITLDFRKFFHIYLVSAHSNPGYPNLSLSVELSDFVVSCQGDKALMWPFGCSLFPALNTW